MEDLTLEAKIAIIKILLEIQHADEIVHEKEVEYLNEVIKSFSLTDSCMKDACALTTSQALASIRMLPDKQKNMVAKMMGNMIICDKDINYNEVRLYGEFCESCQIESHFNIGDYHEYTLSGDFVNPVNIN